MARFRFQLQALLDVAKQNERSLQQETARAETAEALARDRLNETLRVWGEWEKKIRDSQRGELNAQRLQELLRAMDAVQRRAGKERELLHTAARATEAARSRLREAATARLSLEKLRERKKEQHTSEALIQETNTLDDMAALQAAIAQLKAAGAGAFTGATP